MQMAERGEADAAHDFKVPAAEGDADDDDMQYDPVTGDIILERRAVDQHVTGCSRVVVGIQDVLEKGYTKHKRVIRIVIGVLLLVLFLVFVIVSLAGTGVTGEPELRLLLGTLIGLGLLALHIFHPYLQPAYNAIHNFRTKPTFVRKRYQIRWALYIVSTVVTVSLIIALVAVDKPKNLVSLAGLIALILICYVTSYNPAMIQWHPVFWGFSVQFYFAVIILKTGPGYHTFQWLGDRVAEFLSYSNEGAAFVFGGMSQLNLVGGTTLKNISAVNSDGSISLLSAIHMGEKSSLLISGAYTIHFFAFSILPVVIFFGAFIGIMFYLGVMKVVVTQIGHFLSFCLGTTPAESLNAAGNIFVGLTESPMMIRPFLGKMTSSELHAVMTGGFATIAGGVLGVYLSYGVPADHLLSASVMSAPAALAISKLTYPEIEVPIIKDKDYEKMEVSEDTNMIQAASNGAMMAGGICAAILVNVISFLSLLKFVNVTLAWFGDRAGVANLTFELICSYVLYPIALFMGTEPDDCRRVAELIGVKTFTNEFIAFSKLSVLMKNRKLFNKYIQIPNSTWHKQDGDIFLHGMDNLKLEKGILDPRSEVIATYALCGFSNFGSMGICLGGLIALAPHRAPTMTKLIFRAMIAGNMACFFTACVAGLFYEEYDW